MLVTDEDHGAEDPVVISLRPKQRRIIIGSSRLSATLAGTSLSRIWAMAGSAASRMRSDGQPPDPISPLVDLLHELAPGVFYHGIVVRFADPGAYVTYLESLDAKTLGVFAPPKSAIARKPKTSAAVMPDALRSAGFKAFDISARRRGAFGRVDGAPVWVCHHIVTTPRAPIVFCLPDDEPKVVRWLTQCAKGSAPLPDWSREW
jgi:hypothetical protein